MKLEIKLDEKRLKEIQRLLREIPKAMPKVMSRAINRTATSIRAQLVRDIARQINLKQAVIRADTQIQKATWTRWAAAINLSRKRHGLIQFGARQTRTGVTYKIQKAGGRKILPHAFIQTIHGAENVWIRESKAGSDQLVPRMPIIRLKGPSIGQVFENTALLFQGTVARAQTVLEKNIDSQINLMLDKLKRQRAA